MIRRVAKPVKIISDRLEYRRNIVKNIGINNKHLILDICDSEKTQTELKELTNYYLSRLHARSLDIESRAFII